MRPTGLQVPRSPFPPFLKMGVMFPFSQSLGILPDSHDFLNMMESGLATISVSSTIPGMCVIRSHRLVAVQVHQVILNLLCLQWEGLPPHPHRHQALEAILGIIQHKFSQLTCGAWNNSHHTLQFSYDVLCVYADLNNYEKATVGITRNSLLTELDKKGKGEQKFLQLKILSKSSRKKSLRNKSSLRWSRIIVFANSILYIANKQTWQSIQSSTC